MLEKICKFTTIALIVVVLSAALIHQVNSIDKSFKPKVYIIEGVALIDGLSEDNRAIDFASLSEEVRHNAPILINHINSVESVVGRIISLKKEFGKLRFTAELIADSDISKEVIARIQSGALKALSVGLRMDSIVMIETPKGKVLLGFGGKVMEISIVAVPAFSEAEIESIRLKE